MPRPKKPVEEKLSKRISLYMLEEQFEKFDKASKEKKESLNEYLISLIEGNLTVSYTLNINKLVATVDAYKCSNFKCAKEFYISNTLTTKVTTCPYCKNEYAPQKTGLIGRVVKIDEKLTNTNRDV
jgi:hypothetical protein